MARTKQELAKDTLRKLGVLDALHDPSSEDSVFVETRYDDKHAELKDKGLVYWPNTSRTAQEIPNVIYDAMCNVMAEAVASTFGVSIPSLSDDSGRPVSCGTKGLRDLRRHMAKGPSGAPTQATYY